MRSDIFDTLYFMLNGSARGRMYGQEMMYRSGSCEPPGYENMCPSENEDPPEYGEGDVEGEEKGKRKRDESCELVEIGDLERGKKTKNAIVIDD